MKRLIFKLMSRVGTLLSHRQRRFVLDRLGLARLVGPLSRNQFDEVALPDGATIFVNPLLHAHLARDGKIAYEKEVLRAIEENLEPGDVFYDVGANVGVFSFVAARLVGEGGSVHAFEPEENNLVCFRRSLERSDLVNLDLHALALGPADGSMTFDRRGGAFSGRLVEPGGESRGETVVVEVRSVDSLLREGLPAPALIKVDVEGGEGDVLAGMRRTLERHGPTVLCELHFFAPESVRRTLDVLAGAGYACRGLHGAPVDPDADSEGPPKYVLAAPA